MERKLRLITQARLPFRPSPAPDKEEHERAIRGFGGDRLPAKWPAHTVRRDNPGITARSRLRWSAAARAGCVHSWHVGCTGSTTEPRSTTIFGSCANFVMVVTQGEG